MNKEEKKGFSLIEVLVVIAIISIIATVVILNFGQTRNQALLEDGQASIISALELARSRAASGVGEARHGVRIEADRIIIFEEGNPDEETISLSPALSIGAGSWGEIFFDRISAKTDLTDEKTIIIEHSSGQETITISEQGVISK